MKMKYIHAYNNIIRFSSIIINSATPKIIKIKWNFNFSPFHKNEYYDLVIENGVFRIFYDQFKFILIYLEGDEINFYSTYWKSNIK